MPYAPQEDNIGTAIPHSGAVEKVQIHHQGWHGQTRLAVRSNADPTTKDTTLSMSIHFHNLAIYQR